MEKKDILIVSIIIVGVMCGILLLYNFVIEAPSQEPPAQIYIDKLIINDGVYLNITTIEAEYDTPLLDFQFYINNESGEYSFWNFADILNSAEGPLFIDNDNNDKLSSGDSLFVPKDYIGTNDTIDIYHIPTEITADIHYNPTGLNS